MRANEDLSCNRPLELTQSCVSAPFSRSYQKNIAMIYLDRSHAIDDISITAKLQAAIL